MARRARRRDARRNSDHGVRPPFPGQRKDLFRLRWYSSKKVHEQWNEIVIGGTRQHKGMASFADLLTPKQADEIHDYVIYRALHEPGLLERVVQLIGQYACVPVEWLAD